jgi:hypothetical protein
LKKSLQTNSAVFVKNETEYYVSADIIGTKENFADNWIWQCLLEIKQIIMFLPNLILIEMVSYNKWINDEDFADNYFRPACRSNLHT